MLPSNLEDLTLQMETIKEIIRIEHASMASDTTSAQKTRKNQLAYISILESQLSKVISRRDELIGEPPRK